MGIEEIINSIGIEPYYQEPEGVLYCADNKDILSKIPKGSIDLVLTDPPYNCGKNYGKKTNDRQEWTKWCKWLDLRLSILLSKIPDIFSFMSQTALKKYIKFGEHEIDWITIWNKPLSLACCAMPFMPHWEAIAYWGQTRKKDKAFWGSDVISENVTPNKYGHPTEKPLPLLEKLCVNISPPESIILDPFVGSGTTAVASKKLGRCWIGIDIEKEYCNIAIRRLKKYKFGCSLKASQMEQEILDK